MFNSKGKEALTKVNELVKILDYKVSYYRYIDEALIQKKLPETIRELEEEMLNRPATRKEFLELNRIISALLNHLELQVKIVEKDTVTITKKVNKK